MDLCGAPGFVPGLGGRGTLPLAGSAGGAAPDRAPGPAAHPAPSHSVLHDLQPFLLPCYVKEPGNFSPLGFLLCLLQPAKEDPHSSLRASSLGLSPN